LTCKNKTLALDIATMSKGEWEAAERKITWNLPDFFRSLVKCRWKRTWLL